MEKVKLLFGVGLIILFVGATFITLFGAGQALQAVLRSYIFKVEECRYDYTQRAIPDEHDKVIEYEEPKEICAIDYNHTKRDVANGLAMFLVSSPIAGIAFWQGRRMWRNTKEEY